MITPSLFGSQVNWLGVDVGAVVVCTLAQTPELRLFNWQNPDAQCAFISHTHPFAFPVLPAHAGLVVIVGLGLLVGEGVAVGDGIKVGTGVVAAWHLVQAPYAEELLLLHVAPNPKYPGQ